MCKSKFVVAIRLRSLEGTLRRDVLVLCCDYYCSSSLSKYKNITKSVGNKR